MTIYVCESFYSSAPQPLFRSEVPAEFYLPNGIFFIYFIYLNVLILHPLFFYYYQCTALMNFSLKLFSCKNWKLIEGYPLLKSFSHKTWKLMLWSKKNLTKVMQRSFWENKKDSLNNYLMLFCSSAS